MKKKSLSLVLILTLALTLAMSLACVSVFAADDEDYIKINNVDDLYNVRNDLASNYKLMCDIDLTDVVADDGKYNYSGKGWEPFGATTSTEFTGTFDGNGHTISGLRIVGVINVQNGLFWANNGTIKNLTVKGTTSFPYNKEPVIGLVTGTNNGCISNCTADGSIGNSCLKMGFIAGINNGDIQRCTSKGTMRFYGGYQNNKGCWGGICGRANGSATVTECFNSANLDIVEHYESAGDSGGIIGFAESTVSIDNCYNTGKNESYSSSTPHGISGGNPTISNCYNTGEIAGPGISGWKDTQSNCYTINTSPDAGATSLNETQMTMKASFKGFDFNNIWELSTATDYKYPQLRNNMQDPNKHVDILEWKTQPTKNDFYTDEDIDPSGGVFTAYYIDDTHEDVKVTKDMLSGYDMTQLGVQTVTVTFREGSLTYDILTSTRPEVKSLTLETMPDKTEFARGTSFDFTGATAKVEYVNGKTEIVPITAEETTGGDITKSGTYTIKYEKFGKSLTFDVKVVPVKPIGIKITTLPDKTTYIEGQSIDLTGMVVKLTYNSGKTEAITDYTVGEYTNTIGTKDISVSYEDFSTSFQVEFVEKKLTSIMVTTQPTRAKYVVGEQFDKTGMVVKAVYDNGFAEEITDYTVSDLTDDTGWQNLTVSYEGKTATVKVMVEAKELVSIFVSQMPQKTTYIEGQTFDPEGMIVMANYNDVLNEEITDYTLSGTNLNKVGESKITILYEGKTTSFNVTVAEKTLVKIEVTQPEKTEYIAGEELDTKTMVVKAVYDNGKSETVTDYTVSGFGDDEETNIVTVEYKGKTAAFAVVIHTPETQWTLTKAATCTEGGTQELHCASCGKILKTEDVDALGHEWGAWEVVEAPNCTDKGSQKRVCGRCTIEEFKDVDPKGHAWIEEYVVDVEPTCTSEGSESWHCSECGVINPDSVRTIDKLPHNLGEWTTTKEATCAVAGVKQRACADCDYLETEDIPATGNHEYGAWKTIKEPTCTEAGSKDKECEVCHKIVSEEIPTIPHTYGDWTTKKEPTVDEEGSKEHTCTACGHIESEAIPKIPAQPIADKAIAEAETAQTNSDNAAKEAADAQKAADEAAKSPGDAAIAAAENAKIVADIAKEAADAYMEAAEKADKAVDKAIAQAETDEAKAIANASKEKSSALVAAAETAVANANKAVETATASVTAAENAKTQAEQDAARKAQEAAAAKQKADAEKALIAANNGVIDPTLPKVKLSKPKAAKKSMTAKWKKLKKKQLKKVKGIEVEYSLTRDFQNPVFKNVGKKKDNLKIKKLASKKTYYVRAHTYVVRGGTKYVSNWSTVKKVKIK